MSGIYKPGVEELETTNVDVVCVNVSVFCGIWLRKVVASGVLSHEVVPVNHLREALSLEISTVDGAGVGRLESHRR